MLTKEELRALLCQGPVLLDGATGSYLRAKGMPRNCATEEWVLHNPEVLVELQRGYREAGSNIIYAPTFQAQPMALERIGLEKHTEAINAQLLALSRSAAPGCLIAGDIATLAAFCDSWDPDNFDLLVENYRRQIRGLLDGGADLLVGETLLYPQEAEAILTAAELEGAGATMITYSMQSGGFLYSGHDAGQRRKSHNQCRGSGRIQAGTGTLCQNPAGGLSQRCHPLRRLLRHHPPAYEGPETSFGGLP